MIEFIIRVAQEQDLIDIKNIANGYSNELGYVMWPKLKEQMAKQELHVAYYQDYVVGFINWHKRRDGWHTIYEIAVRKGYESNGIGRALINAIPKPKQLKCTVDNHKANAFYEHIGMQNKGVVKGRKRDLIRWIMG